MNLDQLRAVQTNEREKDSLQSLRSSFYKEVGAHIAELEERRTAAAARADDPFADPEVSRLTDEIQTAREVVQALYERRVGKIVKQASLAAAGLPADDEGLTAEESELFETLVDAIEANMEAVLGVLESDHEIPVSPPEEPDTEPAEGEDDDEPPQPAPEEPDTGDDVDRVTIRITQDVGTFVGVDDREYTLAAEDVVTLPASNATPLLERDAAERL